MNIDTIKASFDDCSTEEMAHWVHGLYTGRAIEQGTYFELIATIDKLRKDALDRIKKTQQVASEEAGEPKAGVSSHE